VTFYDKKINILNNIFFSNLNKSLDIYKVIYHGDWGLGMGIGDGGLGIGPNPQSPIPNPQSPIPNPHVS